MEGTVGIIQQELPYHLPYENGCGYGSSVGSGDQLRNGRAYINYEPVSTDYNGTGILSYNNHPVYCIDGYMLYIDHVHEPWMIGRIIKNDLLTQQCYLAKINQTYVVAGSLHDAIELMREKMQTSNDSESDIATAFVMAHPDYEKQYEWDEMVTWHALVKGSCANGRRQFSKLSDKASGDKATPKELIEFMKNSPAVHIAEKMEELYLQ